MSRLILMGPPGAGKGQQSEKLKKQGYNHVAVGDLLRAVVADKHHPLHPVLVDQMGSGGLVDDRIILDIMSQHLSRFSENDKVLLDGFPRTVAQAKAMVSMSLMPTTIIVLVVDKQVLAKRISGRWIDQPSGRVYNAFFAPPKRAGFDDESGRALTQRKDDRADIVVKRLTTYFSETYPVLDYFTVLAEKMPIRITYLDGMRTIDEIASSIELLA